MATIADLLFMPKSSVHFIIQQFEKMKTIKNIVSSRLVRRRLQEQGYHSTVAKKKPLVTNVHRLKRLGYSYSYLAKSIKFWDRVLWCDEAKFDFYDSNRRQLVWTRRGDDLPSNCIIPTVQQGGGNIVVWGCMGKKGVGKLVFLEDNMTGLIYKNILEKNLYASARKLGLSKHFVLMDDNNPKHRSKIVVDWVRSMGIEKLWRPSRSPDLNPLEHIWLFVKRELQKAPAQNLIELKEKIIEIWNSIEEKTTAPLVNSVQNRLNECIKQKGFPTKY
ncbi:unnamed protein product [Rotaria sordida]|uniref:Transposase n=1 Tax=Rotaria sordida TaxID=392033 RepID=A0A815KVB6_9BILA|nr:unnamed protein product [Rotaria sordida]CAF1623358.1 unnamed protein product [Rotaria sordida]